MQVEMPFARQKLDFGQRTVEGKLQLRVRIVSYKEIESLFLINHTVSCQNGIFQVIGQVFEDHILVKSVSLN